MTTEEAVVKGLGEFFDYVWGTDTEGYVYLPVMRKKEIDQYMLRWPKQRNGVIKHVLRQNAGGADVYYSPALFSEPKPIRENVKQTQVLWADFDKTQVDWEKADVPFPTLIVESSPGREHVYWKLDEPLTDLMTIEERNRSIAYNYKADTSGWDANQFLRPPFTINSGWKGEKQVRNPVEVKLRHMDKTPVSVSGFSKLIPAKQLIEHNIELEAVPKINDVIAFGTWNADFWDLFNKEMPDDRSGGLMRLAYYGAENGFSDSQIYSILLNADDRWGKYKGRHDREKRLLDIVNRARSKVGYDYQDTSVLSGLIAGLDNNKVQSAQVVYGFKEFLDADFHVDWMLKDLFSIGGFGTIAGPPGVGKTQIGIQMGISIALGEDFLGWKNMVGKKKVLFLSLEMPQNPLGTFMEPIASQYSEQDIYTLEQNFKIVPTGESVYFDKPEGQAFIGSIMQEYSPDVIFIDSFNKVLSGPLTDEVSIRSFVESLARFRHKYNCGVYMIHHDRKNQGEGKKVPDLDDLYGNRFFSADLEFAIYIRRMLKNVVSVHTIKNRLAEERAPFDIARNKHLHYTVVDSMTEAGFSLDGLIKPDNDGGPVQPGDPFTL